MPQTVDAARGFNPFSFIIGDGFTAIILLLVVAFFIWMLIQVFGGNPLKGRSK